MPGRPAWLLWLAASLRRFRGPRGDVELLRHPPHQGRQIGDADGDPRPAPSQGPVVRADVSRGRRGHLEEGQEEDHDLAGHHRRIEAEVGEGLEYPVLFAPTLCVSLSLYEIHEVTYKYSSFHGIRYVSYLLQLFYYTCISYMNVN